MELKKKEIHLWTDHGFPSFNCKAERNFLSIAYCQRSTIITHQSVTSHQDCKGNSNHSFQLKTALKISTKPKLAHPTCKPTIEIRNS